MLPSDAPRKKVNGQSNGTQMTMAVNEIDALRAKIAQCWNPPPGGLGADAIIVKLRLQLNEDGSLIGYPTVANSGSLALLPGRSRQRRARGLSVPALRAAGEKYAVWRDMILNFDPRQMYGARLAATSHEPIRCHDPTSLLRDIATCLPHCACPLARRAHASSRGLHTSTRGG